MIGCRAIRNDLPGFHEFTFANNGTMVKTGVLIGANELGKIINADILFRKFFGRMMLQYNPSSINVDDFSIPSGDHSHPGILCHHAFNTGAHQRRLVNEQRHCLALHVRTHQRPVGVIIFQKRNQRSRNTHQLVWRNIHQVDRLPFDHHKLAGDPRGHQRVNISPFIINGRIGLGDGKILFFKGIQKFYFFGDFGLCHHPVRGFNKTIFVDPGIGAQGHNQTDIGPFRSLNGTDAPIMRWMHVAHLETRPFAGKTTGS